MYLENLSRLSEGKSTDTYDILANPLQTPSIVLPVEPGQSLFQGLRHYRVVIQIQPRIVAVELLIIITIDHLVICVPRPDPHERLVKEARQRLVIDLKVNVRLAHD